MMFRMWNDFSRYSGVSVELAEFEDTNIVCDESIAFDLATASKKKTHHNNDEPIR